LFTLNNNSDKFKLVIRDFLIQLKEFAGDNAELFREDKEAEAAAAAAAQREKAAKIGGLLKPSELEDDEL
jgi:exportin-1